MKKLVVIYFIFVFDLTYSSSFLPTGDEVVAGSVLLPTTRRGRFLASLIRRQAVDGTGVFFNTDADTLNAKSKQKYNVLSDDLLPYIIAEQERRVTLYKRVMTAIQNGEKGVTVIEFRNKTALFIRKGSLFRCPKNKQPVEPDGSGEMRCEDNVEPHEIVYDSCLNAEDKILYNSGPNKYFFCNRYKEEGPSIMESENKAILCAPNQRTSLSYTMSRCTIQGTNDVIMHYRYYPDHKYEKVYQMDPESEVCDHWRPCSIGYIFALPTPDQAVPATELWDDFVEKYEEDESVPEDIQEKAAVEHVAENVEDYETSLHRITIPDGYEIHNFKYQTLDGAVKTVPNEMINMKDSSSKRRRKRSPQNSAENELDDGHKNTTDASNTKFVSLHFRTIDYDFFGKYRCVMAPKKGRRDGEEKDRKHIDLLTLQKGKVRMSAVKEEIAPGQTVNDMQIQFECLGKSCKLTGVERVIPGFLVQDLDDGEFSALSNDGMEVVTLKLGKSDEMSAGDYFGKFDVDGELQRIKMAVLDTTDKEVSLQMLQTELDPDAEYNGEVKFTCQDCTLLDVLREGDSVIDRGFVKVDKADKTIKFSTNAFNASFGGQYSATFEVQGKKCMKDVAVFESVELVSPPGTITVPYGVRAENSYKLNCKNCTVNQLSFNGMVVKPTAKSRRFGSYLPGPPTIYTIWLDANTIVIHLIMDAWLGFGGPIMGSISNTAGNIGYYKIAEVDPIELDPYYPPFMPAPHEDDDEKDTTDGDGSSTENEELNNGTATNEDDGNSTEADENSTGADGNATDADGNATEADGNATEADGNATEAGEDTSDGAVPSEAGEGSVAPASEAEGGGPTIVPEN